MSYSLFLEACKDGSAIEDDLEIVQESWDSRLGFIDFIEMNSGSWHFRLSIFRVMGWLEGLHIQVNFKH